MIGRLLPTPLGVLLFVSPLAAEPPRAFACRGHEPFWSLRIEGSSATLTELGQPPRVLEGGFRATRARIVQGESGFTLPGEEPVLVALPR
jgi:uncharacterized membrane protein